MPPTIMGAAQQEVAIAQWLRSLRRILISAPPLHGKTTSFRTFPPKRHVLVAPGETGHSSIMPSADTNKYVWEFDPTSPQVVWGKVWMEVKQTTREILGGKHGEVTTFAIDGLHVLYECMMRAKGWTPDTDPKEFTSYHKEFKDYLDPIIASDVPYVVASCYDGPEVVDVLKGDSSRENMSIFPDLPGKMAKHVMGKFPVALHAKKVAGPDGKDKYTWELRATKKVQAVGFHIPREITERLPAELPQDWGKFEEEVQRILKELNWKGGQ